MTTVGNSLLVIYTAISTALTPALWRGAEARYNAVETEIGQFYCLSSLAANLKSGVNYQFH